MRISIAMRKTTYHNVQATAPRLSDEELDPLEQEDNDGFAAELVETYTPWDPEDLLDIQRLIYEKMSEKQQFILNAFLNGLNYNDVNVTEKYWRYHFEKGLQFIKKELGL